MSNNNKHDIILSLSYMQVPDENGRTRGTPRQWCASMTDNEGSHGLKPLADIESNVLEEYQTSLIHELSVVNEKLSQRI